MPITHVPAKITGSGQTSRMGRMNAPAATVSSHASRQARATSAHSAQRPPVRRGRYRLHRLSTNGVTARHIASVPARALAGVSGGISPKAAEIAYAPAAAQAVTARSARPSIATIN